MKKPRHKTIALKASKNKNQTLVGELSPIAWDRKSRVIKFSIYSNEGENIIIKEYRYKSRLQRLLNKKVEVTGEITHNMYGDNFIKLKTIKELVESSSSSNQFSDLHAAQLWDDRFSINVPRKHQAPDIFKPSYNFV